MCKLSEDFEVIENYDVDFGDRNAEDARLFTFKGDLYSSYTEYYVPGTKSRQRYARIDKYGTVKEDYALILPGQGAQEKNWQFFEYEGELLVIYSINPHRIFAVEGDKLTKRHITASLVDWEYGPLHGGTPPVRVGDHYYSFFHSHRPEGSIRRKYYAGVYRFSTTPPFKVTDVSKTPLFVADNDMDKFRGRFEGGVQVYQSVVFPSGAIFEDGIWTIAYGYHDAECRIVKISHEDVLKSL